MKRVLFVLVLVLGLLALIGAASADLAPGGSFTDDDGNVHEANIEAIAAAGITKGCNPPANDRYCPDRSVTRGQMAAFLVRALDLTDDGGGNTFVDDDGSVFEDDIAKLAAAGITKGCNPPANDRYCPDRSVTRGQMAAFLVRALDLTDDGGGNTFVDDDGSVFEDDIAKLAAAGITKGCNPPANDRYCPDNAVRRDQMASFLARALNLDPIVPPPPAGVLFTGPLESQPGLSGDISFEVSNDDTEVKNITIEMDFDNYDCGGGWTKTTTGGKMTVFVTLPITNGSFSYTSSTLTLSGSLDSPTSASGTVSGDEPMEPKCPWGPVSWSATSTGSPPPASSTTTTTTTQPVAPGGTFAGPLQSQPGLTGDIEFEATPGNSEVSNPTIHLVLDQYDCGGGLTRSGDSERTVFVTLPATHGSFSFTSSFFTLSGSFDSPTSASGTVSGDEPMDPKCPWGPLTWTATNTGSPPPPPPAPDWPPCDFTAFSISGSGPGVRALRVPGDKPAILDISFSGTGTFWVDALDINSQFATDVAFDYTGGVYEGVRPINHRWLQGYVHYLDFVSADGSWSVDVKPFCSARAMTGNSISGIGDEVVLINQAGGATITHTGADYFSVWSHQAFTETDLEVSEIGAFDDTVDIDTGTVFLDIEASDTDGAWSVTFP